MNRLPLRRWLVVACCCVLPVALYWDTIFHRFAFRDDYAVLREATTEPGTVTRVCSMMARPIYGWVMEPAFGAFQTIDDFRWLRLAIALLVGGLAAGVFLVLLRQKWDPLTAIFLAALLTVLPVAQVYVNWAVALPIVVGALVSLAAFACAERAFGAAGQPTRLRWWIAAILLVTASALTYQPNSLFYFMPLAASFWPRRKWPLRALIEWLGQHLATTAVGLALAFTTMAMVFAAGGVPTSRRVALEQAWLTKIEWFVREPLPSALALLPLDDDRGSTLVHRSALVMSVLLLAGAARAWQARGARHGAFWLAAMIVLIGGSFSVNLVVGDRWPPYRVLLPLTGTILAFAAMALLMLGGRWLARGVLAALVASGAWLAHRQALALIAWPQSLELALLEKGAERIVPAEKPRVFVITPTPFDRATERLFRDEFGSLSTDSDWAPKEMLKLIMRGRFPDQPGVMDSYAFACGRKLPAGQKFDVVIDLRRLRDFRGLPPAGDPRATVEAALRR